MHAFTVVIKTFYKTILYQQQRVRSTQAVVKQNNIIETHISNKRKLNSLTVGENGIEQQDGSEIGLTIPSSSNETMPTQQHSLVEETEDENGKILQCSAEGCDKTFKWVRTCCYGIET